MASVADYLDLIWPHISSELVCGEARADIRRVASKIPGALAFSTFGFECPLGTEERRADFLFSLVQDNSGPDILAGKLPAHDFSPACFDHAAWRGVRSFGKAWADPSSPLHDRADDVWLEFDVRKRADALSVPNFFFGPKMGDQERDQPEDLLALIKTAYACLRARIPAASASQKWLECLERLPRLNSLFQVGMMLARRGSDRVRVCLNLRPVELVRYLLDVGWPGDLKEVGLMLERLGAWFDSLSLHLDVGEQVRPKIGLEGMFPHRRGPEREPRWRDFLDFLVASGLCRPAKREALLRFSGHAHTDPQSCPRPLKRLLDGAATSYSSFFVRTIYHIKLACDDQRAWEAKAYLGIGHLFKSWWGEAGKGRGKWGLIG